MRSLKAALAVLALPSLSLGMASCGAGFDNKTGVVTFGGDGHGATVITPEGVEFRDNVDIPKPVVVRDVDEPWHAPIGFILPKSGELKATSSPLTMASEGIVAVVRSSDTRAPSWGGEVLLRVDLHGAAAKVQRPAEHVVVVVDTMEEELATPMLTEAFERLGADDHIAVIDARGPRVVVPPVPATHRSLAFAATAQRLHVDPAVARDLDGALALARKTVGEVGARRILCFSKTAKTTLGSAIGGVTYRAVSPTDENAKTLIDDFVPAAGVVAFRDVVVSVLGTPAPTRILEASSGDAVWLMGGSELHLGDLHAGEARAEILRVTVPPWGTGAPMNLHIDITARDAKTGVMRTLPGDLKLVYDDDIERIAESRAGDVIAYASALATMHRLHEAFVGIANDPTAIRKLAEIQSKSLSALAHDFPDRGFAEDAAVLRDLLAAHGAQ